MSFDKNIKTSFSVFDQFNQAVILIDNKGRIIFANKTALTNLSVLKNGYLDLRVEEVFSFSKKENQNIQKFLDTAIESKMEFAFKHHLNTGLTSEITWSIEPFKVADKNGVFSAISLNPLLNFETTNLHPLETNILQNMIENSPSGMVIISKGNLIFANRRTSQIFGYSFEELLNTNIMDVIASEQKELMEEIVSAFNETSDPPEQMKFWINTKDGKRKYILIRSASLFGKMDRDNRILVISDLTENKEKEEALQENEKLYRVLSENVSDVIWTSDLELKFKYVSPSVMLFRGYTPQETMNQTIDEILAPETLKKSFMELENDLSSITLSKKDLLEKLIGSPMEVEVITKDGGTVWAETKTTYISDGKDNIIGIQGVTRDISERKKAEKELEKERAFLNSIIELNPYSIQVFDVAGNLKKANEISVRMFADQLGIDLENYNIFQDPILIKEGVVDKIRQLCSGRINRVEAEIIIFSEKDNSNSDKNYFSLDFVAFPLANQKGDIENLVVMHKDITRQKRTERELQISENNLKGVLNATKDIVLLVDENGVTLSLNQTLADRLSMSTKGLQGKNILDMLPDHVSNPRREILKKVKKSGKPYQHEDQSRGTYYEHAFYPIFDENKQVSRIAIYSKDVTERKKSEKEKQVLAKQLQHTQKLETIGTLAGGIAHDFNNILSTILWSTSNALEELNLESSIRDDLTRVRNAATRAKDLVMQILTFSRQMDHEKVPVKIHLIIEDALNLIKTTMPDNIAVRTRIDDNCGYIHANPTQIQQVLINLCTNATYAMKDREGVLNVVLEKVDVTDNQARIFRKLSAGTYIRLSVSDTGHGIMPEVLERIFEPFFTTKGVGEGTGLGLSVIHGILEEHESEIIVKSDPENETTFQVYFPTFVVDGPIAQTRERKVINGNEKIMLVDDEVEIVDSAKSILGRYGYHVTTFTSGQDALGAFIESPDEFDLIISDLSMPGVSGLAVIEKVMEIRPELPTILMTGYEEPEKKKMAISKGVKEFLQKPVEPEEFGITIRRVLDNLV